MYLARRSSVVFSVTLSELALPDLGTLPLAEDLPILSNKI